MIQQTDSLTHGNFRIPILKGLINNPKFPQLKLLGYFKYTA